MPRFRIELKEKTTTITDGIVVVEAPDRETAIALAQDAGRFALEQDSPMREKDYPNCTIVEPATWEDAVCRYDTVYFVYEPAIIEEPEVQD